MSFIKWCDEISTGIDTIDNEHKVLISLANKLYDSVLRNEGREIINEAIEELILCTAIHFTHEEEYMLEIKYPAFQEHVKEHNKIRTHVMLLQAEAQKEETEALANEVFVFLKGWITGHILFCDKAFVLHFKKHGIE